MSQIMFKNEITEDIQACRACLTTNTSLRSIINQDKLAEAYKNLCGIEVSANEILPQYICDECAELLIKYDTFRDLCQQAKSYLEEAYKRNIIITINYLNNFQPQQSHKLEPNSTTDNVTEIGINETSLKDENTDHFDNNDEYDHHNSSPEPENMTVHTDIIKIEATESNTKFVHEKNSNSKKQSIKNECINKNEHNMDLLRIETIQLNTEFIHKNTSNSRKKTKKIEFIKKTEHIKKNEHTKKNENTKKNEHTKKNENTKKNEHIKKRGKYFETNDNMCDFEKTYDVTITVLSQEQQMTEVLERKLSVNYLHSPYKCELCYKGYVGAEMLKKHFILQHDPSRGVLVCDICQFRYKDRRGLSQHMKSHRLKFTCKQCSFVSRNTFNAKEHFKTHSGTMHKCQYCGKSYEKLSSHLSHLRLKHPSEFIWCDLCGKAFIGTVGLNAHKKRAHRHLSLPSYCPGCDKYFVHSTALEQHLTFNTCNGHPCLRCGDSFEQALELRDHLLEKHRSNNVFACEKCDKTFSRESLYSAHYKRIHVDSEDKAIKKKSRPWVCEVCGKTLPDKCVLMYHQRTHTGDKPYPCSQCPKRFTMKKLLQSHLLVHTNDRPYTCKICQKAFKGSSALRIHQHIHTGRTKVSPKTRHK